MKKILLFSTVMLVLLSFTNTLQAGAKIVSEVRTSDPYHAIIVEGDAEIVLIPSGKFGITVEGTHDQLINMTTLLKNDTLFIVQTNNKDYNKQRTRLLINVDELTGLHIKGNTLVTASGLINTDILTIHAEDGAVVNLDVRALKVNSKTLGCSSINISGSTEVAFVNAGRRGSITINDLNCIVTLFTAIS